MSEFCREWELAALPGLASLALEGRSGPYVSEKRKKKKKYIYIEVEFSLWGTFEIARKNLRIDNSTSDFL